MFLYGRLKTIFMKPSEIPKEKEKEYFCVGDVPKGGIATYNQGYFIPHKTFSEIISKYNSETKKGWTTENVISSSEMFKSCIKLVGGNGTKYNSSYQDATYARIDTAENPGYLTKKE